MCCIIVRAAVELVAGRAGSSLLANPTDETFRIAAVYGIPPQHLAAFAAMVHAPYREGLSTRSSPELTERMKEIAISADLGLICGDRLPLISGESVVGMIYVFQTAPIISARMRLICCAGASPTRRPLP